MSSHQKAQDKRKHPRLSHNIPIKICLENGDIVTDTANISRSGVYCRVEKYIEPMTKLKIHLLLPIVRGGKNTTRKITCQGIIVRTEPVSGKDDCYVAVFFNDISSKDSESIASYVAQKLETKTKNS